MAVTVWPSTNAEVAQSPSDGSPTFSEVLDVVSGRRDFVLSGYDVESTSSLDVTFNAGVALISGFHVEHDAQFSVTVGDNQTTYIFLKSDGTTTTNTTGTTPADTIMIAVATASGGSVTSTGDRRIFQRPTLPAGENLTKGNVLQAQDDGSGDPEAVVLQPDLPLRIADPIDMPSVSSAYRSAKLTDDLLAFTYTSGVTFVRRDGDGSYTTATDTTMTQWDAETADLFRISDTKVGVTWRQATATDGHFLVLEVDSSLNVTASNEIEYDQNVDDAIQKVAAMGNNRGLVFWTVGSLAYVRILEEDGSMTASTGDQLNIFSFSTGLTPDAHDIASLSSSHAIVVIDENDNGDGTAKVVEIDGTDQLSGGTANDYASEDVSSSSCVAAVASDTFVVAYAYGSPTTWRLRVGEVSGTTITYGSAENIGLEEAVAYAELLTVSSDVVVLTRRVTNTATDFTGTESSGVERQLFAAKISGTGFDQFNGPKRIAYHAILGSRTVSELLWRTGVIVRINGDNNELLSARCFPASWLGVATTDASAGALVSIAQPGDEIDAYSGLTIGDTYYLETVDRVTSTRTGYMLGHASNTNRLALR